MAMHALPGSFAPPPTRGAVDEFVVPTAAPWRRFALTGPLAMLTLVAMFIGSGFIKTSLPAPPHYDQVMATLSSNRPRRRYPQDFRAALRPSPSEPPNRSITRRARIRTSLSFSRRRLRLLPRAESPCRLRPLVRASQKRIPPVSRVGRAWAAAPAWVPIARARALFTRHRQKSPTTCARTPCKPKRWRTSSSRPTAGDGHAGQAHWQSSPQPGVAKRALAMAVLSRDALRHAGRLRIRPANSDRRRMKPSKTRPPQMQP